jgi:hypothetical protein
MKLEDNGKVLEAPRMQSQQIAYLNPDETYNVHLKTAERLQAEAWAAFNSAFHAPEAEEYRRAGRELYDRVLHERLTALYLRGDEQNSILDSCTSA